MLPIRLHTFYGALDWKCSLFCCRSHICMVHVDASHSIECHPCFMFKKFKVVHVEKNLCIFETLGFGIYSIHTPACAICTLCVRALHTSSVCQFVENVVLFHVTNTGHIPKACMPFRNSINASVSFFYRQISWYRCLLLLSVQDLHDNARVGIMLGSYVLESIKDCSWQVLFWSIHQMIQTKLYKCNNDCKMLACLSALIYSIL